MMTEQSDDEAKRSTSDLHAIIRKAKEKGKFEELQEMDEDYRESLGMSRKRECSDVQGVQSKTSDFHALIRQARINGRFDIQALKSCLGSNRNATLDDFSILLEGMTPELRESVAFLDKAYEENEKLLQFYAVMDIMTEKGWLPVKKDVPKKKAPKNAPKPKQFRFLSSHPEFITASI